LFYVLPALYTRCENTNSKFCRNPLSSVGDETRVSALTAYTSCRLKRMPAYEYCSGHPRRGYSPATDKVSLHPAHSCRKSCRMNAKHGFLVPSHLHFSNGSQQTAICNPKNKIDMNLKTTNSVLLNRTTSFGLG